LINKIENISKGIESNYKHINELKESINKTEKEIEHLNLRLEKIENGEIELEMSLKLEDEDLTNCNLEIDEKEVKFKILSNKLNLFYENYNQKLIELEKDINELNSKRKKIKELESGEVTDVIYNSSYEYGKEIEYGYWKDGELEKCLKNVEQKGKVDIVGKYKVGYEDFYLVESAYIERRYCMVPEKTDFDQ